MTNKPLLAADLFCGLGGTTTGLKKAARRLGRDIKIVAVNHWSHAINTYRANYPEDTALCVNLDAVNPREVVPDGHLDLLTASPECVFHSRAASGRPIEDQSRVSAWHIPRWTEHLRIDNILIENVPEFRNWGPLNSKGRPIKRLQGHTYQTFLQALESQNYRVEARVIKACDYGDPQERERVFIMCRRGRRLIRWPDATHGEPNNIFGLPEWKSARSIIQWEVKGRSIYNRKKALSPNTIRRILHGLEKFGGPHLAMLYGTGLSRSLDRPLPTITASGQHIALAEPCLIPVDGKGEAPTLRLAKGFDPKNGEGILELFGTKFLVETNHGCGGKPDRHRARSLDRPLGAVTGSLGTALVETQLTPISRKEARGNAFLIKYYGSETGSVSLDRPIPTITGGDHIALVQPIVQIEGDFYKFDILLRMLEIDELSRGQSFPENYLLTGRKKDQVKQIGNAVPVETATALNEAILRQHLGVDDSFVNQPDLSSALSA